MVRNRPLFRVALVLGVSAVAAAAVCAVAAVTAGYAAPVFPSLVPPDVDIVTTKEQYESQLLAKQVGQAAFGVTLVTAVPTLGVLVLSLLTRRPDGARGQGGGAATRRSILLAVSVVLVAAGAALTFLEVAGPTSFGWFASDAVAGPFEGLHVLSTAALVGAAVLVLGLLGVAFWAGAACRRREEAPR